MNSEDCVALNCLVVISKMALVSRTYQLGYASEDAGQDQCADSSDCLYRCCILALTQPPDEAIPQLQHDLLVDTPGAKVELFCRQQRMGWRAYGNKVKKFERQEFGFHKGQPSSLVAHQQRHPAWKAVLS